jgi:hypothetical protein
MRLLVITALAAFNNIFNSLDLSLRETAAAGKISETSKITKISEYFYRSAKEMLSYFPSDLDKI